MRLVSTTLLSLMMALSLTACSQSNNEANADTKASEAEQPAQSTAVTDNQGVIDDDAVEPTGNQDPDATESDADGPIKAFTAFSNTQASWRAVIDGETMMLEGADIATISGEVHRIAYAKGVEYSGTIEGNEVNLNIRGDGCKDADGNEHEFSAKLDYNGKLYQGCATEGAL